MTSHIPHHILMPRPNPIGPPPPARVTRVDVHVTDYTAPVAATSVMLHFDSSRRRNIRFEFSLVVDTSEDMARGMGQALALTEDDVQLLGAALEREVAPYRTARDAR